jgi:hypothetical protein
MWATIPRSESRGMGLAPLQAGLVPGGCGKTRQGCHSESAAADEESRHLWNQAKTEILRRPPMRMASRRGGIRMTCWEVFSAACWAPAPLTQPRALVVWQIRASDRVIQRTLR